MHFIHLAQDPTPVSDAVVVEVVQQATEAIDAFSNLGVFMAVLFVIALLIILFGAIVLVLVWSNRNSSGAAVNTLSQSNTEKINELIEIRRQRNEEITLERNRHQQNHEQFMLMFAAITNKQVEGDAAVVASMSGSQISIVASVEGARDDIVEGLKEYRSFNIIILDMLLQDPPAGRSRIKRAMKAFAEGNVQGAQAVADESEPKTATNEVPAITRAGAAATEGDEGSQAA